jgi:hypothetical protein
MPYRHRASLLIALVVVLLVLSGRTSGDHFLHLVGARSALSWVVPCALALGWSMGVVAAWIWSLCFDQPEACVPLGGHAVSRVFRGSFVCSVPAAGP